MKKQVSGSLQMYISRPFLFLGSFIKAVCKLNDALVPFLSLFSHIMIRLFNIRMIVYFQYFWQFPTIGRQEQFTRTISAPKPTRSDDSSVNTFSKLADSKLVNAK
jgi:hypothetical protein